MEVRRPHARGYGDVVGRRRRVCGGQQLPHGVERVRYPPARYEYGGDTALGLGGLLWSRRALSGVATVSERPGADDEEARWGRERIDQVSFGSHLVVRAAPSESSGTTPTYAVGPQRGGGSTFSVHRASSGCADPRTPAATLCHCYRPPASRRSPPRAGLGIPRTTYRR